MNYSTDTQKHTGKIALVTGSNKGLGRETARRLGLLGMTVFATARNKERGRQTVKELKKEGADIRFLQLDITDKNSVYRAAEYIDEESGRLDVLINNAGITVEEERPSTEVRPSEITADQVRRTYEVNVFGVVAVTRAILPLLRRSEAARIVNMSSPLGSLSLRTDPENLVAKVGLLAYDSSKTALNSITLQYANGLWDYGIFVNAANPGYVATDLNTHTGHRTVEQGAAIVVELATLDDDGPIGSFLSEEGPVPW